MPKRTVYLETSVIGYATARKLTGVLAAARQTITQGWFAPDAASFDLFVSQAVIREVAAGDPIAAKERAVFLQGHAVLATTDPAKALARDLIATGAVPREEIEDALHIAIAAVHAMDYLLTWNCRHIANATMRGLIERVCREAGYEPAVICTPEELTSDDEGR